MAKAMATTPIAEGDGFMNRATIQNAAAFTAIVASAFIVRNALVIGGLSSLLAFVLFSN